MKNKYLYIITSVLLASLFFSFRLERGNSKIQDFQPFNSTGPAHNGNGDRTGSPLGGSTCSACHSGGSFSPIVNIIVKDNNGTSVATYSPGQTYTLEYIISSSAGSPSAYGMQSVAISPNVGNVQAGVMNSVITAGTRISSINGRSYVEHSTPSSNGIFEVSWTAPNSGFGNVNIYAGGLAVNGNGGTSGDQAVSPVVFSLTEECAPTTGVDTQTACDSLQWIDGNTYFSNNGTATHTLTSTAGCDSVVTLNLTINTVNSSVTQSGVNLNADLTGAIYQWLNCNTNYSAISGETNQNYVASMNGSYAVQITQNGCVDTSACNSVASVGVLENSFGNKFLVYPNPTNGNFSIDLGSVVEATTVNIVDINGKLIQSNKFFESQLLNIGLSEPNGVYLLFVESKNKKAVIRLIKE